MRMLNVCVAVCCGGGMTLGASWTCTLKLVPLIDAAAGEPEIRPLARTGLTAAPVLSCRPVGSGESSDQVRLFVPMLPPTASIAAEYGCPVTASGKAVVTTVSVVEGMVMPLAASSVPTACAFPAVVNPVSVLPLPATDAARASAIRANEAASRIG